MPTATPVPGHDVTRITLSVLGIAVLIGGSVWVLRPFLVSLVWATTIVVATWPLLLWIQARFGGRRGAAVAVMTLLLLLILFVPLYLAIATIIGQSDRIAGLVRMLPTLRVSEPPQWIRDVPVVGPRATELWTTAASDPQQLTERLAPHLKTGVAWFAAQAGSFGGMLLNFLITVLISGVLYAKGEGAADQLRRFFRRLTGERGDAIVTLAGKAIRAVALGVVVTAVVQTTIAGIGLALVGVPFAGLLTAVIAMLCLAQVGPLLAMIPGVIWLYSSGSPGRGTVLLVITVFVQAIDNIIRPLLIRKGGADLSLLLILSGVIGGLIWLGIIGLFVGPVILAVASTLLERWIATGLGEAPQDEAPRVASAAGDTPPGGGAAASST